MDTIGKYQLVRIIGEGGMGRVYEAIDPIIGRRVAVKTISLNIATDAETRTRFFREAQAAGRLSHPNLITIHDIGDADGTPFIVMEYLEGMDLNRKIRHERLTYDAKMQIMVDVCEGLAFAHGHEIVHRDIKPANIFITTNGRAKILDFGLARGALSDVTQTGKIVGTPNYMSPEQIRDEGVDHRSDIFAAGVVFYELLVGRKAFEGETVATTLYKVLETQPDPVHLIDEELPAKLSGVIERALAKDRLDRFQTSGEMLDAVLSAHGRTTQFERSRLSTTPPKTPSRATAAPPPRRTRPTVAAWSAAGVVVAVAIAGVALWSQRSREATPSPAATQASPAATAAAPAPAALPEAAPAPPPPVRGTAATPTPAPAPAGTNTPPKGTLTRPPALAGRSSVPEPAPTTIPPPAAAPVPETRATAVVPPAAPPVAPEPKAAPVEPPAPVAAPPVVPAPAPAPPAATPPAARPEESPQTAVQALLARYRAALESRDINALKRIWPALSGRQEDAIRNEFEHSRAIAVGLEGVDIRPTGNSATVTCRRSYAVTTGDGQTLRTATTMIMTLARHDGAWNIEAIRHEVAR